MLRELWRQKRVQRLEGQRMPDHIHRGRCTPPTESVTHTSGGLKGKSAVRIHRELLHKRRMTGLLFWATGYAVSTVGLDEARSRQSIREREKLESGQGDPGSAQMYCCAAADLFIRHAKHLRHSWRLMGPKRLIKYAQGKAEQLARFNRKQVLRADDWMDESLPF